MQMEFEVDGAGIIFANNYLTTQSPCNTFNSQYTVFATTLFEHVKNLSYTNEWMLPHIPNIGDMAKSLIDASPNYFFRKYLSISNHVYQKIRVTKKYYISALEYSLKVVYSITIVISRRLPISLSRNPCMCIRIFLVPKSFSQQNNRWYDKA